MHELQSVSRRRIERLIDHLQINELLIHRRPALRVHLTQLRAARIIARYKVTIAQRPLRKATPYEQPAVNENGEMYTLNPDLVGWALELTRTVPLADSDSLRSFRSRFAGFPNALKPPFVTRGDEISGSTFWHGALMDEWANAWTSYFTGGKGNYMISAMEDTGTLQALTFLSQAGRGDMQRVLVLRTVSNYDRQPPGTTAAASLKDMATYNYSAYMPALEAAETVGDKVVRDLVEHWGERESTIPHSQ
jgi:purine nucleoside permease